jgi:ATP-dependent helicase HrpB
VILEAPPGAGKTTLVPIALHSKELLGDKKIIMLEPRRLAARNACYRISSLLNEDVGKTVGYRVRFDSKISSETKIEIVTEGIFTQTILNDPELKNIGLIIFDEFHERNIDTDLGLALALKTRELFRNDLKILIMSATIDTNKISEFLNNAPIIKSTGKMYPVSVVYLKEPFTYTTGNIVTQILRYIPKQGDVLVFLPGSGEIKSVQRILEEKLNLDIDIRPLYGELNRKEQELAIFKGSNGKQKVILSTNIAESSLTIEGISLVIDSGFVKKPCFDPSSGMTKLKMQKIARDSSEQRRGRAGRLGNGSCVRLWTEYEQSEMSDKTKPEILDSELSSFLLDIIYFGVSIDELKLIDRPPESSINRGIELLKTLGAIDEKNKITKIGKEIARLPVHPRLGKMVLKATEIGQRKLGLAIAALLSSRDIILSEKDTPTDLQLRVEILLQVEKVSKHLQINHNSLDTARKIFNQISDYRSLEKSNIDISKTGLLLSFAYPERIGKIREKNSFKYKLSSGKAAFISEKDSLFNNEFLVFAELDGDNKEAKAYLAAPISEKEIYDNHKEQIISETKISFSGGDKVKIIREDKFLDLIIKEKEENKDPSGEESNKALISYIKENGLAVIGFGEKEINLQNRVNFLLNNGFLIPDINSEKLLSTIEDWISPYISNFKRISDLKKLDPFVILKNLFTYQEWQLLEKEAPERFKTLTGSSIKLDYNKGEVILSVKLQEMFGVLETPKIAGGKISLTVQLLSPAMRPLQTTKDLQSFWKTAYQEIRKELKGKYPKHNWPENPYNAKASKK